MSFTRPDKVITYAESIGRHDKSPFLLTECCVNDELSNRVVISLDQNGFVYNDQNGRKFISDPNGQKAHAGIRRWSAGGSLNVFYQPDAHDGIIPLILRDNGAPHHRQSLGMPSGISSEALHWYDLSNLSLKHGLGKLAVLVSGKLVHYNLLDEDLAEKYQGLLDELLAFHKLCFLGKGLPIPKTCEAEVITMPSKFRRTFEINVKTIDGEVQTHEYLGLYNHDRFTNGIDFLQVRNVSLPSGDVTFMDCTGGYDGILDREIYVFSENNIITTTELTYKGEKVRISGASYVCKTATNSQADSKRDFLIAPVVHTAMRAFLNP